MNDFSFQIFSICKNPGFGHRDFCMKRTVMLSGSGKKSGFTKGKSLAIKKPANSQAENKKNRTVSGIDFKWLGYVDSNHGNGRFRVCCLTAWLYPNALNHNKRSS